MELASRSPDETLDLGRRLARILRGGDVVLLAGRLGSGKTLFVGGLAEGLGVQEQVTSPSFALVHEYHGFLKIVHADMYRIGSVNEFKDLELAVLAAEGVLVIEWGGVIATSVPDHLLVQMAITSPTARSLRFRARGSWVDRSLEEMTI
jgi:tRNA threonylcarbamoyladenosine biosynthesis protein TsaE